jgi:hypothetical protein
LQHVSWQAAVGAVTGDTTLQIAYVAPYKEERLIVCQRLNGNNIVEPCAIAEATGRDDLRPSTHDHIEREPTFPAICVNAFAPAARIDTRPHVGKREPRRRVTTGTVRFALRIFKHQTMPHGTDVGSFAHGYTNR